MTTQSNSPSFPSWFVADCPPADVLDAEGMVYRYVEDNPIVEREFLSYHEAGECPKGRPCERCGLSVFRTVEDTRKLLKHLWKNYPAKNYGQNIVRRELSAEDGKTKQTGRHGHHTWWAYEGIVRHVSFEFVEKVPKN